ncbi:hypothetical protein BGW80DRAFT_1387442 [Lactifluus volemus]|nr:hypothetical protein BGW80DRAFT_1387442 [Lactifluus volemus]
MPYYSAFIRFFNNSVTITFSPRSSIDEVLKFEISCIELDWQVSSVAQICNQLSFVLSRIEQLSIGWILQHDMDDTQWLELFQPFTSVRTLRVFSDTVLSGLRGFSGESAMQVLPALEELQLTEFHASQYDWPFIVARLSSDHPVVVRQW